MLSVGGIDASSLVATMPDRGIWSVLAELVGIESPEIGSRVNGLVGDLAFSGTVLAAGVHAGHASAFVVAGAGRWQEARVERRQYPSTSGVRLAEVARDLAAETGEQIELEPALAEMTLGPAWTRPAGLAIDALNDLGVSWWVALVGVTHLGTRPQVERTARFGLESYDHATGRAVLVSPDDAVAAAQPGSILDVNGVRLEVRACTVRASATRLVVEVHLGAVERLARILEAIQDRAKRRAQLAGPHLYRVQMQVDDRVYVQSIRTGDLDLPDHLALPVAHGLQGVSQLVRLSEKVLVAFEGGDIGHPVIVGWLGGLPMQTALDALQGIAIGASLEPTARCAVGGGTRPVAMGDALEAWVSSAHALLQAIATAAGVSGAAELSAYNNAVSLGWSSTVLETR